MAVTVATYGIGRRGGVTPTMGYGFSAPKVFPVTKAFDLVGADNSIKSLCGARQSENLMDGADPGPHNMVGPRDPDC